MFRTVLALVAIAAVAQAKLSAQEKQQLADLLSKSSKADVNDITGQQKIVDDTVALDNKQTPEINTNNGKFTTRVKRSEDVTVQRVRLEDVSIFGLSKRLDDLETAVSATTLDSVITTSINDAMKANTQITTIIESVADMKITLATDYIKTAQFDKLSKSIEEKLASTKTDLEKTAKDAKDTATAVSASVDKTIKDLNAKVAADVKKAKDEINTDVQKTLKGTDVIMASLKRTYHSDGTIPVFRWQKWSSYNNCGIGWFDGNSDEGFGGVHPSHWTDSNYRAYQMKNDFKYLRRLFIHRATADHYGATICAENFIMHSSTNGLMCGAVFRIMNKATSTITWRPEWRFTSYSGWGERASITVNGNNNWSDGGCHGRGGGCTVTQSLNIPANSNKNRISTVIFVSGGTNYYGWGAWNWRANLHMFRNGALRLPSGLEYVEDMDTKTGGWKQ